MGEIEDIPIRVWAGQNLPAREVYWPEQHGRHWRVMRGRDSVELDFIPRALLAERLAIAFNIMPNWLDNYPRNSQ